MVAGPSAAGLDVVQDQDRSCGGSEPLDAPQPTGARCVKPALTLHRLEQHGGRWLDAAAGSQHVIEQSAESRPSSRRSYGRIVTLSRGTPAAGRRVALEVAASEPSETPWNRR